MSDLRAKYANLKAVSTPKNLDDFFSALVDEIERIDRELEMKLDIEPIRIAGDESDKEPV